MTLFAWVSIESCSSSLIPKYYVLAHTGIHSGAVMSEKGVRCFFRGKSNLKTVLESLRGLLLGIQCCQKILSMAT